MRSILNRFIRRILSFVYRQMLRWERITGASTQGAGIAVWYHGQLLVVHHSYRSGSCLPGGKIRRNEEPRMAAVRELEEEVGVTVQPRNLVPVPVNPSERKRYFLFEFSAKERPALKIDDFEIVMAAFVAPEEIRDADYGLTRYLRLAQGRAQISH